MTALVTAPATVAVTAKSGSRIKTVSKIPARPCPVHKTATLADMAPGKTQLVPLAREREPRARKAGLPLVRVAQRLQTQIDNCHQPPTDNHRQPPTGNRGQAPAGNRRRVLIGLVLPSEAPSTALVEPRRRASRALEDPAVAVAEALAAAGVAGAAGVVAAVGAVAVAVVEL